MSEWFVCIGLYASEGAALDDLEQLVSLGASRRLLLKDAAIVTKTQDGLVEIVDKTSGAKAGSGAMIGALVGVLFPPSILASAAVGGAAGGVLRHVTRALSRADVKDLGEMLDRGEVCLIAVAEQESADVVTDAMLGATERVARPMTVDRDGLEEALREIERS